MGSRPLLAAVVAAAVCLLSPAGAHAASAKFAGETITAADEQQTDRLNQTGPSSCSSQKPTPSVNGGGGTRDYDRFEFKNIRSSPVCVTVTLNTTCTLHSTAYQGFDVPANLTTGYLGDRGTQSQPTYGFIVPANTNFIVAVTLANPGEFCEAGTGGSYDLTVDAAFAPNVLQRADGLSGNHPKQTGRPSPIGSPSTCAVPRSTPAITDADTHFSYDAFTFTNTGGTPSCVTVWTVAPTCSVVGRPQSVAYLDSFNPASVVSNFLAYFSTSGGHFVQPYSFSVPAGRTFVVVVSESVSMVGCGGYQLSVDGNNVITGRPASNPAGGGNQTQTLASVSRLGLSNTTFAAEGRGPSATDAKRRSARGTKVSFRLNQAATVRFTVERRAVGRKVKRGKKTRCVKPTKTNRKKKRCARFVKLKGSFSRNGVAGTNRFRFTGRLRGKKLRPGRYRLVATPTAGGKTGRSTSRRFRIVR